MKLENLNLNSGSLHFFKIVNENKRFFLNLIVILFCFLLHFLQHWLLIILQTPKCKLKKPLFLSGPIPAHENCLCNKAEQEAQEEGWTSSNSQLVRAESQVFSFRV